MPIKKLSSLLQTLVLGIFLSTILACSGGPGERTNTVPTKNLSGQAYKTLEGTLTENSDGVSGSGSLVFTAPRADEDSNYAIKFNLQKSGSVTLVTNSSANLERGVSLVLERREDDKLGVKLISAKDNYDLSEDFSSISAAGTLEISVDVHGHGHLIVFAGANEFEYTFEVRPKDLFWGLKLNQASIAQATADKAKKD